MKDPLDKLIEQNAQKSGRKGAKPAAAHSAQVAESDQPPPVFPLLRRRRKRGEDGEEQSMLWLITFTDIMALMLTFFVLLYSMSTPDEEDWKEISTGISREFREYYSAAWNAGAQEGININKIDVSDALNLGYLQSVLEKMVENNAPLREVNIIPQEGSLIVSLPQDALFEKGEAEIADRGRQLIFMLGGPLSRIKNRVEIIGHTDPDPIAGQNAAFSDNWSLSLARASNVAAILKTAGYERALTVRGLATGRYEDLPASMAEADKEALSRRVDIVIMRDDGQRENWWQ